MDNTITNCKSSDWEWLTLFCDQAKEVGQIVVDDFATIKKNLIDKNEEAMKRSSGSDVNKWLSKRVVKNFVQAISKSIENLSELKVEVVRELRHRYPTLDGEWMSEDYIAATSNTPRTKDSSEADFLEDNILNGLQEHEEEANLTKKAKIQDRIRESEPQSKLKQRKKEKRKCSKKAVNSNDLAVCSSDDSDKTLENVSIEVNNIVKELHNASEDASHEDEKEINTVYTPKSPTGRDTSVEVVSLCINGDSHESGGTTTTLVEKTRIDQISDDSFHSLNPAHSDEDMFSSPQKSGSDLKEIEVNGMGDKIKQAEETVVVDNEVPGPSRSKSSTNRKKSSLDKDALKAKRAVLASSDSEMEVTTTKTKKDEPKNPHKSKIIPTKSGNTGKRKGRLADDSSTDEDFAVKKRTNNEMVKENEKPKLRREKVVIDRETDIKLNGSAEVRLPKLDKAVEDDLEAVGYIKFASTSSGSESDKKVRRHLRNLDKFDPIIKEKDNKDKKTRGSPRKTNGRKCKLNVKYGGSSESDAETSDSTTFSFSVIPKKIVSDSSSGESSHSDNDTDINEYNEETAKAKVLSDSDVDIKIKKESKVIKNKSNATDATPGKKYYTPTVWRISSSSDEDCVKLGKSSKDTKESKKVRQSKIQDGDSSDEFIPCRTRMSKKRKVASCSDDSSLKSIHSDHSDSSTSESENDKKNIRNTRSKKNKGDKENKKRRKRIKVADDSSASEGQSEDSDIQEVEAENTVTPPKGRKNIRKVLTNKKLDKSTREAEKDEEERKKRVLEKQRLFNHQFEAPRTDKLQNLVLDFDNSTKEATICVDESVVCKLKPHQANGIKFMYDSTIESLEQVNKGHPGGGCIIAHCMGLGKTLSTIGFVHTVLTQKLLPMKTALIICPLNTVGNWYNEFIMWLENAEERINVHKLWDQKTYKDRADTLAYFIKKGGVGIIHYDLFRRLTDLSGQKKLKQSIKDQILKNILDGPEIVVCDEGHLLKNHKSKLSIAVNKIKSLRRVVLTGTPLQNNLGEYHTMMSFVKPNLLGTSAEFQNRFIGPIKNGQHADSVERDVKLMKKRAHVLHKLLEGCVQRMDYSVLTPYLPPKYEYVVMVKMSPKQVELYKYYLENLKKTTSESELHRSLLKTYAYLVKIWTHPLLLPLFKQKIENANDLSDDSMGSLKDFIDDNTSESSSESGSDVDWLNDQKEKIAKKKKEEEEEPVVVPTEPNHNDVSKELPLDWYNAFFDSKDDMYDINLSGKLIVLQEIIKTCESIGDKVLVFSQYLSTLNIIEEFLADWDKKAKEEEKNGPVTFPQNIVFCAGRWRKNIEYYRLDGGTKTDVRQDHCDKFNNEHTSRAKLFLISTRAGGLGINLVGANRVVIFDASWNPSHDMQSVFRVYRFGQQKPCYIYRLLAEGTMEEKIYNRQVVKLSLSGRVVDEHQIQRHFKFEETNAMYTYDDPDEKLNRPIPPVPKDRLLADILADQKEWVLNYLEHDTLLENKMDEGLTEEERKAAWDEYQVSKDIKPDNQSADLVTLTKIMNILFIRYPNQPALDIKFFAQSIFTKINQLRFLMNNFQLAQHSMTPEEIRIKQDEIERVRVWIAQALGTQSKANTAETNNTGSFNNVQMNQGVSNGPVALRQYPPGALPSPESHAQPLIRLATNIIDPAAHSSELSPPPPNIQNSIRNAVNVVGSTHGIEVARGRREWVNIVPYGTATNPNSSNHEN